MASFAPTLPKRLPGSKARNCIVNSAKSKIDIKKQGLEKVKEVNKTVYNNLAGISPTLERPDFVDPSGKKGKGIGVYRFAKKYGANVDGYSPIYTPDIWSQSGEEYALGTKGLLAWAAFFFILLAVGANLIVSTSAL